MTDKLSGYSTTPASNNAASPDGWPEGMTAGSVNNSDREFAARVREFYEDSQWIDYGHTIVSSTGSSIKLSGDVTTTYTAGRAIRVNQSASMDGWVSASAYSAPDTSITVTGFTVAAPTQVEVGAVKDHTALPNNLSITVASLAVTGAMSAATGSIGSLTVSNISITGGINGLNIGAILNTDTYDAGTSAVYSKPAGYDDTDTVLVQAWGGGASGGVGFGSSASASGGGGGSYFEIAYRYQDFPSSSTYTVGAGVAAVSRSSAGQTNGNSGNDSTVTINGVVFTANGGGAGVGSSSSEDTSNIASADSYYNGVAIGYSLFYGGIGGGASGGTSVAGGSVIYGGGGGGGDIDSAAGASGGTSIYGGNGGAGGSTGVAGTAPGGGGGGGSGAAGTVSSGAGAAGRVQFTILRGWRPTAISGR